MNLGLHNHSFGRKNATAFISNKRGTGKRVLHSTPIKYLALTVPIGDLESGEQEVTLFVGEIWRRFGKEIEKRRPSFQFQLTLLKLHIQNRSL